MRRNQSDPPYDPTRLIPARFHSESARQGVVSANERTVLQLVRRQPGIQRSALTARMDLTQQSIHRIVDGLTTRGLLCLGDPQPRTGRGQPSPTLYLNPDYAVCAGIAIDTDAITLSLLSFDGKVLSSDQLPNPGGAVDAALALISDRLEQRLGALSHGRDRLFGIGMAIPGFLEGGTTYNTPLPLIEWSRLELGPYLSAKLGCPVWTGNISNAAAVCETMLGLGRHLGSFAYLSFDFGFGGAVVLDGELWRGAHGNAGELSAMFDVDEMGTRPALEYLLTRLTANGVAVTSVRDLRERFDPAWPGVEDWIEATMPTLNRTVNSIYAILDPDAIVFGGHIPKRLAEDLISRVTLVRKPRHGRLMKTPRLLASDLNLDAPGVGAAVMPFKAVFF
ncbi:ROK family transcriptional regulator [Oceanibium sediminis]|uniref:ROK family transcriptional regulator n=1 Tax=Oceanibium sediminis TaxID=2026339 RepID=UPI000DD2B963|nr:ROK family transcriptional regulator [Oceanibium sediminis]